MGAPKITAQVAALDAVDAFVRKGKLTKAEVTRLSKASFEEVKAFNNFSPPPAHAARGVSTTVRHLLTMAIAGAEDTSEALASAAGALGALHKLSREVASERIHERFAAALQTQAHLSDAPLAEKTTRADAKKVSLEGELLATSRAALPAYGQKLLDHIGAARDAKRVGTAAELGTALTKHGYPAWPAVSRYHEEFGGLLIPSSDDKRWREDDNVAVRAFLCSRRLLMTAESA